MDANKLKEFFTYGDHCWSIGVDSPISGFESSEGAAGKILQSIVGKLAKYESGIKECISYALELDGDAYAVNIVGTPIEIARMDGLHSGYAIHISIVPRFTGRHNEEDGRLVRRDGYPG